MVNSHLLGETGNIRVLNLGIVKIIEVVEDEHFIPARQQLLGKMGSNEARAACD